MTLGPFSPVSVVGRVRVLAVAVLLLASAVLAVQLRAEAPAAAAVPTGFTEVTAVARPRQSDGRALRLRRPGLRRREERADQGLRQPLDDARRPSSPICARTSTTSGTAACSGWPWTRTSRPAQRLRPLHVRPPRSSAAPRRRRAGAPTAPSPTAAHAARPDDRRLRRQRPAVAPAARRRRDDRRGAGAHRGLVPAVPEPLDRRPRVRPGRGAVRERRRRCELQRRRLRTVRHPAQPLRRPARRPGGATPPTRRAAPCAPGPAHHRRPGRARRHRHPHRSGHRRGAAGQPARGSADANARRIVAYGFRNPFRFTFRPGTTSSGSATSAGTTGKRSTGSPTRRRAVENFGWPCYEGNGRQAGYDARQPDICESLYAAGPAPYAAALHVQPQRERRRRRDVPDRQLVDLRARLHVLRRAARTRRRTTARCSSPTTRATASGR